MKNKKQKDDINKKKVNEIRTSLLISINQEMKQKKLNCITRINSKSLAEAEEEFTAQNEQVVVLKVQNYISRSEGGTVINSFNTLNIVSSISSSNKLTIPRVKSSFSSLLSDSESSICSMDYTCKELNKLSKKTSISQKKIEFFKYKILSNIASMNTDKTIPPSKKLSCFQLEERLEYINIDKGFFINKKTRGRVESAFKFLKKLCRKYKKRKKNNCTNKADLLEMLSLKDNVDLEEIIFKENIESNSNICHNNKPYTSKFKSSSNPNLSLGKSQENLNNPQRRNSNFIFMLNGEVLKDDNDKEDLFKRNFSKRSTFSFINYNNILNGKNVNSSRLDTDTTEEADNKNEEFRIQLTSCKKSPKNW